jgi:hypothetical protein
VVIVAQRQNQDGGSMQMALQTDITDAVLKLG